MLAYPPDRVRTVALVGHTGSGKTTLTEALLREAGATTRLGRVEDGTTVSDFEPEEVSRHMSLSLAIAPIEVSCGGVTQKLNLLDTPGDPDLAHEVDAALRIADLAVVVVSAVDGVEVGTEAVWRRAEELGVPRLVFVNKLDRERASFERTLDELRERLGAGMAALELPVGEESAFRGVADLLTDRAYLYGEGRVEETDVPAELAAHEHEVHDALVEGIVVADDAALERYLDGEEPSFAELEHLLADGVSGAQVFPVVCGSATRGIGVDRLVQYLCEIGPSAATHVVTAHAGDTDVEIRPDPAGQPLAQVIKTIADPFVGRISVFKVLSGTIHGDDHLVNPRTGADERLHHLFVVRGKEHLEVAEVHAGDIAAVAKLSATATGDTLAPKGTPVVVDGATPPEPVIAVALVARTQADDDKLGSALHKLVEEDPALRVRRDEETRQTLLEGAGETHLSVAVERLRRKFGVDVGIEDVRVPYRETITASARGEGRHKKQSGGHGQFGVVEVTVEPLPRGAGFEFVDAVVGGAVPRQFIPAVEKGIVEAMAAGGVLGHPVVDIRVALVDGKSHPVDSSELAFKTAGALALRDALAKAGPVVLEPVSEVVVVVDDAHQGDVLGDLNARRGRVQGTEALGGHDRVVRALVPTAELARYAVDLRSLTGGRGRFHAEPRGYELLPAHLARGVTAGV